MVPTTNPTHQETNMAIRNADNYDTTDRTVLIREQADGQWYWSHPTSGEVHGSTDSEYVRFSSLRSACVDAHLAGYNFLFDTNNDWKVRAVKYVLGLNN